MRAVDTNVLVRLITRDDPAQVEAAERFVEPGAWASHVVLAEAAWVLASDYEMPAADVAAAVEFVLRSPVAVEDPPVVAAALARFRSHPRVGFADCLILEAAARAGHSPLGTFDRALAKLDGATGL